MQELAELVEGLDRINVLCDRVLVKLGSNEVHIPVVIISNEGHSCDNPMACRLNTTVNPFWCMTMNDRSDLNND